MTWDVGTLVWSVVLVLPGLQAAFQAIAMRHLAALVPHVPQAGELVHAPKVSIVIPACNEMEHLEAATCAKLESDYPNLEIVLVDDRSTDGTSELVDTLAAKDARVRAVHIRELPEGWLGKVHALYEGTNAATGDWLLYCDADVHLSPTVLRRVVAACERDRLDFATLVPLFWSSGWFVDIAISSFFTLLCVLGRIWETQDPKSRVAVGAGLFNLVRRTAYDRSPGFPWLKLEVADDVTFAQMMKKSGARCFVFNGSGDVKLFYYRSVREMILGLEKNGYAVMGDYRPGMLVLRSFLLLHVEMAPLVAAVFARGWIAAVAMAIVILQMVTQARVARWASRPWTRAVVPAFGIIVLTLSAWRSALLAHLRGGITWRGTFYPLRLLREGRRFEPPL